MHCMHISRLFSTTHRPVPLMPRFLPWRKVWYKCFDTSFSFTELLHRVCRFLLGASSAQTYAIYSLNNKCKINSHQAASCICCSCVCLWDGFLGHGSLEYFMNCSLECSMSSYSLSLPYIYIYIYIYVFYRLCCYANICLVMIVWNTYYICRLICKIDSDHNNCVCN